MSRFNSYARKVDEIAKQAFEEYRKAEKELKRAQDAANATPQRMGVVDPQYAARYARAQADLAEAKNAHAVAKHRLAARKSDILAIKKELQQDISNYYTADPAQIDGATLELLKSGILKPHEYSKLMNDATKAGNHTMARMIGKYADSAAAEVAKRDGENSTTARELRVVGYQAQQNNGGDRLEAFQVMEQLYDRCVNNPGMIDYWEQFTAETVADF